MEKEVQQKSVNTSLDSVRVSDISSLKSFMSSSLTSMIVDVPRERTQSIIVTKRRGSSVDVVHKVLTEKAKMHIKPHEVKAIKDYLIMVRESNDYKNEPEWDSSEQCLMRDMIEAKRTNLLATRTLENKRKEQLQTRAERDEEIRVLEKEETEFGDSFIYYNKFIKDNAEKRDRAIEKIKTEKGIRLELDAQIAQTEKKISRLTNIKNDMLQYIEDRREFVDFLEEVRALSPNEFNVGVHEVAERFELLLMVREELANQQAEAVRMVQEYSNKIFKMTDERAEELINLRNRVTELYCQYDIAKHDALYWESIVNAVEEMSATESAQLTRVKSTCWDLYTQICDMLDIPQTIEKHEIQKQLAVIEDTVQQLRRTLFLIRKKKRTENLNNPLLSKTKAFKFVQ